MSETTTTAYVSPGLSDDDWWAAEAEADSNWAAEEDRDGGSLWLERAVGAAVWQKMMHLARLQEKLTWKLSEIAEAERKLASVRRRLAAAKRKKDSK